MTLQFLWSWLFRLLPFRRRGPHERRIAWPTREQIAQLPPFDALQLTDIVEIFTPEHARKVQEDLLREPVLGFDTESKPIFVRGHVSTGPHVAQFATAKRAYIFMLHHEVIRRAVATIVASEEVLKVGFGLGEDLRRIPIKLGVQPRAVLDLESIFSKRGYGRGVGVKVAVAITMRRQFMKSRKASTSNWMKRRLNDKQLLYAANDAYAAMRVYHELGSPEIPRKPSSVSG